MSTDALLTLVSDTRRCLEDVATEMRARGRDDSRFTQLSARLSALARPADREHIVEVNSADMPSLRTWMASPNGAFCLPRCTLEATAHGGIFIRTASYGEQVPEQPAGTVRTAFMAAMTGMQYGEQETNDAFYWFKAGYEAAPPAASVDYPKPRNRKEAAALAKIALAHLGVVDAHIDAAIARCETDALIDSAGGAKGDSRERVLEMFLGRIFAAQRVGDDGEYKGWKIAGRGSLNEVVDEARDYLNCPLTNTPQPDGGDRAVAGHVAMLRSLRMMYDDGVMDAGDHLGTVAALDAAITVLTRPSAAAAVPERIVLWSRNVTPHWYFVAEKSQQADIEGQPVYETLDPIVLKGSPEAAPAAPKTGVDEPLPDFLERIATELVARDKRGGTFAPSVAMSLRGRAHVLRRIDGPAARAEQGGQEVGNG